MEPCKVHGQIHIQLWCSVHKHLTQYRDMRGVMLSLWRQIKNYIHRSEMSTWRKDKSCYHRRAILVSCWSFMSLQLIRSCQEGYQLVTVCTHDSFIVLPHGPISHSANQSLPYPINAEHLASKRKVSILYVIDLTPSRTELSVSHTGGRRSTNSVTAPGRYQRIRSAEIAQLIRVQGRWPWGQEYESWSLP